MIRERVRTYIRESFFVDDFGDGDSFLANGLIDSLGVMQLVSFVEAEYRIRVDDSELVPGNFDSVECVAEFVERKRKAAA